MKKLAQMFSLVLIIALLVSSSAYAKAPDANYIPDIVIHNSNFYTYVDMTKDIDALQKWYAGKISVEVIGTTIDNRDIHAIRLGNKITENQKEVVIFSTIHGWEFINTEMCMEMIENYLSNWNNTYTSGLTYEDIFNECNLVIIPCLNPDGMNISMFGIDGIKDERLKEQFSIYNKNTKITGYKANANGVDLNRNFPRGFGAQIKGAVNMPSYQLYCGESALSENETSALCDYLTTHNVIGCVSYHSQGKVIYSYCNQDKNGNKDIMDKCFNMANICANCTSYYNPKENDWDCPERGLEHDYICNDLRIPCIEIESGTSKNYRSQYSSIYNANKNVGIALCYGLIK